MGALRTRLKDWIKTLVGHGISTAVEEAEVVARACECRGGAGQASCEGDKVDKHGDFLEEADA